MTDNQCQKSLVGYKQILDECKIIIRIFQTWLPSNTLVVLVVVERHSNWSLGALYWKGWPSAHWHSKFWEMRAKKVTTNVLWGLTTNILWGNLLIVNLGETQIWEFSQIWKDTSDRLESWLVFITVMQHHDRDTVYIPAVI